MNVLEVILSCAEAYGQRPALIQGEESLSFAELQGHVRAQADFLRAANPRPTRVGMSLANSIDDIVLALAVILAGHTLIALPPHASDHEKANHLQCCSAEAILVRYEKKYVMSPLCNSAVFPHTSESIAFIRPTSGTTGASKGVMLSHRCIATRIDSVINALMLGENDTLIWTMAASLHFASSILAYLKAGTTVVLSSDARPGSVLALAGTHRATMLYGSPWQFRMLASDSTVGNLPYLRWAISTGQALPESTALSFEHRFGYPLRQAYGIIEAGLVCINVLAGSTSPATVGPVAPGFSLRIADEEGNRLPDGQIGEVRIKGAGLFSGYITQENECAVVDQEGFFPTGDLGLLRDDALILMGRKASQLNVAGFKFFPEEIEAVLEAHASIFKARVHGRPESRIGHVLIAEVVVSANCALKQTEIFSHCRKYLERYKMPLEIRAVASLPETSTGKLKRY